MGLVVMHNQDGTRYTDLVAEVVAGLETAVRQAVAAGVPRERVIVDPGIGFGKTWEQNLVLLRRLEELRAIGQPLLVGSSRKSFLGRLLDLPVGEREEGTAATIAAAVLRGADIVRVHDVRTMARVARVAAALR
jgi:dihydropteroate synthase